MKEIYGGDGVDYEPLADERIARYESQGFGKLPICMAKTQYSLSSDAEKLGVPTGFRVKIKDIRASVGAGFVFPLCGDIQTIPGLAVQPAYYNIDIDESGDITGLF